MQKQLFPLRQHIIEITQIVIMILVLGRNNFRLIMWKASWEMKSTVLDFIVEML